MRIYLEVEIRRVNCKKCGKVKQETLDWLTGNPFYTKRFAFFVGRHRGLLQAGEQGRLGIRRGREQQDPRHSAAELRLTRRGVPAPESPHLHARPDMKSGRNHPLGKEKTLYTRDRL